MLNGALRALTTANSQIRTQNLLKKHIEAMQILANPALGGKFFSFCPMA
jgi:hypothetical protein